MSVQRVTLTAADEKYAPAGQEIEVAVISGRVFITVYDGSVDDLAKGRTKAYEVPELWLHDLLAALGAFGVAGNSLLVQHTKPEEPLAPEATQK